MLLIRAMDVELRSCRARDLRRGDVIVALGSLGTPLRVRRAKVLRNGCTEVTGRRFSIRRMKLAELMTMTILPGERVFAGTDLRRLERQADPGGHQEPVRHGHLSQRCV